MLYVTVLSPLYAVCNSVVINCIHSLASDAFDLYFGVVIFRLRAGFDATERKKEYGGTNMLCTCVVHHLTMIHAQLSLLQLFTVCIHVYSWTNVCKFVHCLPLL